MEFYFCKINLQIPGAYDGERLTEQYKLIVGA